MSSWLYYQGSIQIEHAEVWLILGWVLTWVWDVRKHQAP